MERPGASAVLRATAKIVLLLGIASCDGCENDQQYSCLVTQLGGGTQPPKIYKADNVDEATKKCQQETGATCSCSPRESSNLTAPN